MSRVWLKPPTDHLPARFQPADIYFIRGEHSSAIKIGMTRNVKQRLRLLRVNTPEPLSLILVIHGPVRLETALHTHFRHLRIHGEWFEPGEDLLAFIHDRALNGWSKAEQREWMAAGGDPYAKQEVANRAEWLRTKEALKVNCDNFGKR